MAFPSLKARNGPILKGKEPRPCPETTASEGLMRTFTALLRYDNPDVENSLVTRGTPDDTLPHVIEVTSATAPADSVDVFELIAGEPLAPFALYEFRHTRASHNEADESRDRGMITDERQRA